MDINKKEELKEVIYSETEGYDKYLCPCGYVYDEAVGDPENGISAGTKWTDIPDDWLCPVCDLAKDAFQKA